MRMQALISALLDYSRVGTRVGEFIELDLEVVLADVLAILRGAFEETGAIVTHDPLPCMRGDRVQIGQLIQNLIGNAMKFHGNLPPRVHVSAARQDGAWQISVMDHGIGIEPEYVERVFVIFERLHGPEEYPGTGIGLAICKRIVERHGGRIWVEPTPGNGATFCFTLPDRREGGS